MAQSQKQDVGRLAFREEGNLWNAYHADRGSMEGALLLGSIRMSIVTKSPKLKQAFMDLMRDVLATAIQETFGVKAEWNGPEPAPEHERSGHG